MRSKKLICLLFILLIALTGCKKQNKTQVESVSKQDDTKYVYIIYSLDKEYRIGLDNSFTARDIGSLDIKYKDVNLMQLTKYIIDDNQEYLDNTKQMSVYVDTKEASYYNQCIVQIAALISSSYPSYNVEYLNLPKENTVNDSNGNEQSNQNIPSSNDNNNSNVNNSTTNTNGGNQSNNSSRTVLPTISYACPDDYELKEGKCIKKIIYNADKQPTCQDGYNYDESKKKCLKKVITPVKEVVDCYNGDGYQVPYGESELNQGSGYCLLSDEMQDADYSWDVYDECPSIYGRHCTVFYETNYKLSAPEISCPENSIAGSDNSLNDQWSWCQDENGHYVTPISVSCPDGEDLEGSNMFRCKKIEYTPNGYKVRSCRDGRTLIKYNGQWDKCALIVPLYFGMYCDEEDGEEMINGECVSYQEQAPTTKYQCNSDDESYNTTQCIHLDSAGTITKYNCPDKYVLTVEYMCIER